jgi:mono/diheme cytochrome c family protein
MIKRLIFLFLVAAVALGVLMLFSYDIIKLDWISMMEIQPSYKPMENPLPVPAASIPIDGAVYPPGGGAPVNLVKADDVSIQRGAELYRVNCVPCHGKEGKGDGVIGTFFQFKPADLTSPVVQQNSDGGLFLVISNGVEGRMPALNENFYVRERWDLVNYIRTLAATGSP